MQGQTAGRTTDRRLECGFQHYILAKKRLYTIELNFSAVSAARPSSSTVARFVHGCRFVSMMTIFVTLAVQLIM
jgi:hypothetical protein